MLKQRNTNVTFERMSSVRNDWDVIKFIDQLFWYLLLSCIFCARLHNIIYISFNFHHASCLEHTVASKMCTAFESFKEKQVCIPVGCVPSIAVPVCLGGCLPRGCLPGGCLPTGGVCLGDVCSGGVSSQMGVSARGVCVSQHALRQTPQPLWTEFLTHACENITFPQLRLRTVNT